MAATVEVVKLRQPVIAEDDGVLQRHGCAANYKGFCSLREENESIVAYVYDGATVSSSAEIRLTPARARYIARKLYHLARRIERREVGQ